MCRRRALTFFHSLKLVSIILVRYRRQRTMNDKLIPVLAVVVFLASKGAADVGLMDYSSQCVGESGVTYADAESISQGTLPTSQQGKCYVSCILKSLGVADNKGKISVDNANRLIDMYSTEEGDAKEKTKQAVTMCAREANTAQNRCEVAYKMMGCALRMWGAHNTPQTRTFNITLPQSITLPLPLPPIRFPALINIPLPG